AELGGAPTLAASRLHHGEARTTREAQDAVGDAEQLGLRVIRAHVVRRADEPCHQRDPCAPRQRDRIGCPEERQHGTAVAPEEEADGLDAAIERAGAAPHPRTTDTAGAARYAPREAGARPSAARSGPGRPPSFRGAPPPRARPRAPRCAPRR